MPTTTNPFMHLSAWSHSLTQRSTNTSSVHAKQSQQQNHFRRRRPNKAFFPSLEIFDRWHMRGCTTLKCPTTATQLSNRSAFNSFAAIVFTPNHSAIHGNGRGSTTSCTLKACLRGLVAATSARTCLTTGLTKL
ncbi:unnamed protein product [Mesocestoides corti]|uniref:Secreted protein n=1 Tax=Mesocestoides corti TaxID=53468 RepID=A0A0R3UD93_MESCO|nr:unnamed protein product [Mesocestoides corti]